MAGFVLHCAEEGVAFKQIIRIIKRMHI